MSIEIILLIMLLCLLLEGFFSGSEIAIISADKIKLRHQAAKGSRGAKLALDMLQKPEWLLSTTLIGTNLAVVTNTTLATDLSIQILGVSYGWVAIFFITPLIWIFGEIVPKSVFQQHANQITPKAIFFLRIASYLFLPLLFIFTLLSKILVHFFGKDFPQNPFTLREEIISMLKMPDLHSSDIQAVEKNMIERLFGFSSKQVKDVMVPLIDVVAVEKNADCQEAMQIARSAAHVRIPVYEKRVDKIIGLLDAYSCLGLPNERPIKAHIRPVRYVPDSKLINNLLQELRHSGDTLAVVVDEFGGAKGIITLEDIMEEIVEEIEDEYDDTEDQRFKKLADNDYLVNARIELEELQESLGIHLPAGEYTTLAGFLLEQAGEVPEIGEMIQAAGYRFHIKDSSPQAIQQVQIQEIKH